MTLFTADPHQHQQHPQVFYRGKLIPLEKNPKILGVTLDTSFTFGLHAKKVVDKVGARLKVLKALAGTDWGNFPEDMLLTYKSLAASIIDYAAPIYAPNLKPTHMRKLPVMQNHCLRVMTGCHAAASMEHLHHETHMLPVKDHLHLLC